MSEITNREYLADLAADIERERLDRYVQAVASGWFAAPEKPAEGINHYGDNPRMDPVELLAPLVVAVAVALMNETDKVLACEHEPEPDEKSLHEELSAPVDPPLETAP